MPVEMRAYLGSRRALSVGAAALPSLMGGSEFGAKYPELLCVAGSAEIAMGVRADVQGVEPDRS